MKSEILGILKKNYNSFVSGQEISKKFGMTRAAVWKYIKQLQTEGYVIESVPKNGYKLKSCPDILTYDEIVEYLNTNYIGQKIVHFDSIDSTNIKAKELAESGESEGTVVIAETQTNGRGKIGRQWYSQSYKGILMSIILRPNIDIPSIPLITQIGCAAVGKVTQKLIGGVQVKWPNDIFINGKKLCGILTEGYGEMDKVDYIILGIGINVNQNENDFPETLTSKATSLRIEIKKEISRKDLICKIFYEFEKQYDSFKVYKNANDSLDFCRKYSSVIGKDIFFQRNGQKIQAKAVNLSNQGQLLIQCKDGTSENISVGDISIL